VAARSASRSVRCGDPQVRSDTLLSLSVQKARLGRSGLYIAAGFKVIRSQTEDLAKRSGVRHAVIVPTIAVPISR